VVPDDELDSANALVFSTLQWATLIGPGLAGLVTSRFGAPVALLIDALSFGAMALLIATTNTYPNPRRAGDARVPYLRGFQTLWAQKPVRYLTMLLFVLALSYFPLEPALPLFTERTLRADADAYGLIWVGFGIGAALSFALINPLSKLKYSGVIAALIAIAWGISIFPVLVVRDLPVIMALFAFGGLAWGPYIPLESSILQRLIPADQMGEVFGARSAIINLTNPLGVLLGGALLGVLPPEVVIAGSAAGCILAGLFALLSGDLRAVRRN
jgi:predicted MFS family arabinose efflux permease